MQGSPYGEGPCAPCESCARRKVSAVPCDFCGGSDCGHGRICPAKWASMRAPIRDVSLFLTPTPPTMAEAAALAKSMRIPGEELLPDEGAWVLDDNGDPRPAKNVAEFDQWIKAGQGRETRTIRETFVGGVRVSTIFTGFDFSLGRDSPPRLWETMIFDKRPPMARGELRVAVEDVLTPFRDATREAALARHEEIVVGLERTLGARRSATRYDRAGPAPPTP